MKLNIFFHVCVFIEIAVLYVLFVHNLTHIHIYSVNLLFVFRLREKNWTYQTIYWKTSIDSKTRWRSRIINIKSGKTLFFSFQNYSGCNKIVMPPCQMLCLRVSIITDRQCLYSRKILRIIITDNMAHSCYLCRTELVRPRVPEDFPIDRCL